MAAISATLLTLSMRFVFCIGQVSIVAFFAVPPSVINRDNISSDDEISKFMRLFKRFINIPETETDRLAAWGIREVVHMP